MNKSLLIVTTSKSAYAPKRLVEEAALEDLNAICISYKSLSLDITPNVIECKSKGEHLPTSDYVILREPGQDGTYTPQRNYLLEYYTQNGTRVLNKDSFARWPTLDKLTQAIELQKKGRPFVESVNYCSLKQVKEAILVFPVIVKHHSGSHGERVFKVNSKDELINLVTATGIKPSMFLIQPFLPGGEDLRVIVIGGKAVGAMKRIAKEGSHLSNYSAGGSVEKYDLASDSEAERLALETARLFECEYAGVDLMKDNAGKWCVLEINRSCQFEGFEKATGINVAHELLTFLQTE